MQLICRVYAMGNYPQLRLIQYGHLRCVRSIIAEWLALVPGIDSRDLRLVIELTLEKQAAIAVRQLV